MAKLPSEFVKAPATRPARRRSEKTSLLDPEAARALLREVIVRLTEAEHRALEEARAVLARAGEEISLEQMIHRVIAEWTLHRAEAHAPPTRLVDVILAQLRRLASSPMRTWRELGAAAVRRLAALGASSPN